MVRATVTLAIPSDPEKICAVNANFEVLDTSTGTTLFLEQGASCIEAGACESTS